VSDADPAELARWLISNSELKTSSADVERDLWYETHRRLKKLDPPHARWVSKILEKGSAVENLETVQDVPTKKGKENRATPKSILTPLRVPDPVQACPEETWTMLKEFIRKWVWLSDPSDVTLSALWIATTYLKPILGSFYHFLPEGRTETGKTQLLTVAALLSYEGYMAHNPTPAALFRALNDNPDITLFLEEQNIPKRLEGEAKEVVDLFLVMVDRGKKVLRVEKTDTRFHAVEYAVFGGIGFTSKNLESMQEDLFNRCITIAMGKPPVEQARPKITFVDSDEARAVRSRLNAMRKAMLERHPVVPSSEAFAQSYRFRDMFDVLKIAADYFGVTNELEAGLVERMKAYRLFKRETHYGEVVKALIGAWTSAKERGGNPTLADVVSLLDAVDGADGKTYLLGRKAVATMLRKLKVRLTERKTMNRSDTYIELSKEDLLRLANDFGHGDYAEDLGVVATQMTLPTATEPVSAAPAARVTQPNG
jgi:hypothetical protein